MKPLFWRIGAVAASATLAFSLFGCSAGNNQQSNEGDDTVSGKVSDNSGAAEEQTQEPQSHSPVCGVAG